MTVGCEAKCCDSSPPLQTDQHNKQDTCPALRVSMLQFAECSDNVRAANYPSFAALVAVVPSPLPQLLAAIVTKLHNQVSLFAEQPAE